MKAIIYARVSSTEQENGGFSIPAQIKLLNEYALKNNFKVIREFIDVETAKMAGRENFSEMIQYLQRNPDVKTILCEKTDRLYRNFADYVTIDKLGLDLHLVKENELLNKDSKSHQKFIHGIKVLMAKNYTDNLSEETRKGQTEKAEQGNYPSNAPLGYKNCHEKKEGRDCKFIDVDETSAPIIKKIFNLYSTGNYSLEMITKIAHNDGLRTKKGNNVGRATLHKTLHNPIYYGTFQWGKKLYKGTHTPLITKELFDAVQEAFGGLNKPKLTKKQFAYSGLMVCGVCGCAITAEIQKGKHIYYHCTGYKSKDKCNSRFVREEELTNQFADIVKKITIDDTTLAAVKQALLDSHKDELEYYAQKVATLSAQKTKLENRLRQIYLDRIDGKITEQFSTHMSEETQKELDSIGATIAKHENSNINYLTQGNSILELCNKAYDLYLRQTPMENAKLLRHILLNCTLNDVTACPTYRSPFDLMVKEASCQVWGRSAYLLRAESHYKAVYLN